MLIDGEQLARLTTRCNVGCRIEETLRLKRQNDNRFELPSTLSPREENVSTGEDETVPVRRRVNGLAQ
jgi:hypothetical protein